MPLDFIGEFEYHVDSKGRIPLPPPFRERLGREGVVITPGLEGCIRIYPLREWEKRTEEYAAKSDNRRKIRRLLRFNNALSFSLVIDRQNRIALPPTLRQYAEIQDVAVVTGVGEYLELWSRKRWQVEKEIVLQEAWQNSETLE